MQVTWTAPSGVTDFRIQRQVAGAASNETFETLVPSQSETIFTDENVERGKTYIYRVLSRDGSDLSDPSDLAIVAIPLLE